MDEEKLGGPRLVMPEWWLEAVQEWDKEHLGKE
jgi:hypothetical protein